LGLSIYEKGVPDEGIPWVLVAIFVGGAFLLVGLVVSALLLVRWRRRPVEKQVAVPAIAIDFKTGEVESTSSVPSKSLHYCVPAWRWCITPQQLFGFLDEVAERYPDHDPNAYQVVEEVIKPKTRECECSYALMLNPGGVHAKYFVTHAWAEGIKAFGHAIKQCGVDGGLWICFLANPQTWRPDDLRALLGVNPFMSPFYTALDKAEHVLAVRNANLNMYTRLWCVFELWAAFKSGKPVMTVGDNPDNIDPAATGYNANCSSAEDAEMLRSAIDLHGKRAEVNSYIGQVVFK